MCKYCEGNKLLSSSIKVLDDIIFFDKGDEDIVDIGTIKKWIENIDINIQIDRGHLVLWVGEDRACLDHADDKIKANYCLVYGEEIK